MIFCISAPLYTKASLRIHTNNWGMWLVDRNQSQESESEVSSYNRRILSQILET